MSRIDKSESEEADILSEDGSFFIIAAQHALTPDAVPLCFAEQVKRSRRPLASEKELLMSVLNKIAFFQNRRDEIPNQALARELATAKDAGGIAEIAENLWHKEPNVQSDCLKVLYEIGYLDPSLIAAYAEDFLRLLKSKNNRLVWGSMIALSTIAELQAEKIFPHLETIQKTMEKGSVITVDAGVMVLAGLAAGNDERSRVIIPHLLKHLESCRLKEVPQHAEKTLPAINAENKDAFIAILKKRLEAMTAAQASRVRRVIRQAEQHNK